MAGRPSTFVIDFFARKIAGWRVSTSMATGFVLDALNQAICQRAPSGTGKLIYHSDRGSQYLSIRYTERLADAGSRTEPAPPATATPRRLLQSCSLLPIHLLFLSNSTNGARAYGERE